MLSYIMLSNNFSIYAKALNLNGNYITVLKNSFIENTDIFCADKIKYKLLKIFNGLNFLYNFNY